MNIETDLPDFYLASTEGYGLDAPRHCWRIRRVALDKRDDALLVRISPPLIGQKYGLGGRDIDLVIVAPRHQGASLFPVSEWPLYVHVARPKADDAEDRQCFDSGEFELIAWAELYRTEEQARLK